MDIKEFAKKVQDMRKAQKEFFKARKMGLQTVSNQWLDASKKLEREVDAAATAILSGATEQSLF
jgi:hypothetical protein